MKYPNIIGQRLITVPFSSHHVENYHKWLLDPKLLELTASEPLTLEEVKEIQNEWKNEEKVIYILVKKDVDIEIYSLTEEYQKNNMIGDVNLFIYEEPIELTEEEQQKMLSDPFYTVDRSNEEKKYRGELDIMISKEEDRSKGYGKEGVLHMIYYGIKFANIKNFFVKINEKNSSSIGLFKSLGFDQISYSETFGEYEFSLRLEDNKEKLDDVLSKINGFFTI